MSLALVVLVIVLLLIAVRRIGTIRFAIWQIMLGGAVVMVGGGVLSPRDALHAINRDVMLFLFGVFVIGQALIDSGYLQRLSYRLFIRAKTPGVLLAMIIFGSGLGSALLMNDTLAIIGTPLMVLLARQHRLPPQLLLLALAFSITTGSVMSPIGNPQNLLIAVTMENPFIAFAETLAVPALLALALVWGVLRLAYSPYFDTALHHHEEPVLIDARLATLGHIALMLLIGAIAARILAAYLWPAYDFPLPWIALVAAAPLLFYRQRLRLLREIDWATLIFFAALFIVMAGVWRAGVLQNLVGDFGGAITSLPTILFAGLGLSQLISNVPLVSLYLPLLQQVSASPEALLALAASSTLAGNLLVMGAASNVIVIQNGERLGAHLGYWTFARVGLVLTLLQMVLIYPFLRS